MNKENINIDKLNTDKLNIEETPLKTVSAHEVDFSEIQFEEPKISDEEIDKIHIQEPDISMADEIFDKDFEVIYEGELPPIENDFGNDAYKDVLASLAELDPTDSVAVDYLAENRTRTFRFPEDAEKLKRYKNNISHTNNSDKSKEKKKRKVPKLLRPFIRKRS